MSTNLVLPMKYNLRILLLLLAAFSVSVFAAGDSPPQRCDSVYKLSDAFNAIEPGVLIPAVGEIPEHCRVRGVIDGTIRFELSMPIEGWQGRFLFMAPGGLAGVIGDTRGMLKEGFAQSTTDSGHEGPNDPSFYRDDHAKINFGFRSNHLTTVLSKKIIAAFYGKEVEYAYLWGCSKGGHGALMEALRFPDDFDGIIAGAPAVNLVTDLPAFSIQNSRLQKEHRLTRESAEILDANSRRACDLLDGAEDGLISNPKKCTLELLALDDLECSEGQTADCLTAGQIEFAEAIYTGIKDDDGNVVVPGVYPGAESGGDFETWITGPIPFLPDGMAGNDLTGDVLVNIMHRDPEFNLDNFDITRDRDKVLDVTATVSLPKPDLSGFMESGGKLIVYNGWHDHPCRAAELEAFYAEAQDINGSEALDEHMRVFMVPGMVHCVGGPGAWAADYYAAIIDWVENDKKPERILGEHPGEFTFLEAFSNASGANWHEGVMALGAENKPDRKQFSRPLCPYPAYARYDGKGDINDAASFDCVVD